MLHTNALIPWLDPTTLIHSFGPFALIGVCLIVFAETGLLIGFVLIALYYRRGRSYFRGEVIPRTAYREGEPVRDLRRVTD